VADSRRRWTLEEVRGRIEEQVIPEPNSGCLLWCGGLRQPRPGRSLIYGMIRLRGKMTSVHRVAYEIAHGPVPDGQQVLHGCDVPLCVNPAHLFLGTNADNIADKVAKDRARKRLTRDKADTIRTLVASGVSQHEISRRYGVAQSTISRIMSGERRPAGLPARQE
jgi:hypothetical protein